MTTPAQELLELIAADAEAHARTILDLPHARRAEALAGLLTAYQVALERNGAGKSDALRMASEMANGVRALLAEIDTD